MARESPVPRGGGAPNAWERRVHPRRERGGIVAVAMPAHQPLPSVHGADNHSWAVMSKRPEASKFVEFTKVTFFLLTIVINNKTRSPFSAPKLRVPWKA